MSNVRQHKQRGAVMNLQSLVVGLTLCFTLFGAAAQSTAHEQDARVIELLRRNGSDFSKRHLVDYFLVVPNEAGAKAVAAQLEQTGYSIREVGVQAKGRMWEVHAQRFQLIQLEAMQATTTTLTELAKKLGGYYDGWGAVSTN